MSHAWIKLLPYSIKARLEGRHTLQKVLSSTGWLFIDKIIRMGMGLVVTVWIARYLGPKEFGLLNYATAFAALFSVLASLGLEKIVVRDLLRETSQKDLILGTTFFLRFAASIAVFSVTVCTSYLLRPADTLTLTLVAIIAGGMIFQSFDTIDYWFQSQILSKYTVYAKNAAFLLLSVIKIILLLIKAPLTSFAWAASAEIMLGAIGLIAMYRFKGNKLSAWRGSLEVSREMLRDSWPLILSGIAIMIYMRIDQIMLGQMIGDRAVGIYSATIKISEIWYFIPLAVCTSIFPVIINSKNTNKKLYLDRLQKLYDILAWISISGALIVSFFADQIIYRLYGPQYALAGSILRIHIWSGVFVFLGVASGQYLVAENLTRIALYRTSSGAIVNVILNLILIPRYSFIGAALATLISQCVAMYLFDVTNKSTRTMFLMKTKSLSLFHCLYIITK